VETIGNDGHDDAPDDGAKTAAADTLHLNGLGREGRERVRWRYELVRKVVGSKVMERK